MEMETNFLPKINAVNFRGHQMVPPVYYPEQLAWFIPEYFH